MKRRTRITVETAERLLLRRRTNSPDETWCAQCGERVFMATPDTAAVIASTSPRAVYRWVEHGTVHFIETPEGSLRICLKSLLVRSRDTERDVKQTGNTEETEIQKKG